MIRSTILFLVMVMAFGLLSCKDSTGSEVVPDPDEEVQVDNFKFQSHDGVELAATISLPGGPGPFPSVVLVHGSGILPRSSLKVFADVLVRNGFGVLTYDKRGTGQSGGSFREVDHTEDGTAKVKQLGKDALAAIDFLKDQERVGEVGLFGWSQAGWVNAHAGSIGNENVDFIVNVVGPVCTVGEEIHYSALVTNGTTIESANLEVARYDGMQGYDPVPDLKKISIPVLWVLGGQDGSIPTQVTLDRLNQLIEQGRPFEVDYHPNANHFLQDVSTGQRISYMSREGGAIDWIRGILDN